MPEVVLAIVQALVLVGITVHTHTHMGLGNLLLAYHELLCPMEFFLLYNQLSLMCNFLIMHHTLLFMVTLKVTFGLHTVFCGTLTI